MIEPQVKKIDDFDVTVQAWPARKAWKYQIMLGKVFGPSLKELGAAFNESKTSGTDFDIGKIGEAFASLFENLSEAESESILMKIITGVLIDSQEMSPEIFDLKFQGKMASVYKVVFFVLEVNYGSFLDQSGIGQLLKKAPTV